MRIRLLVAFVLAFAALARAEGSDVPLKLSHEGFLLDADDRPVTGSLQMRFAIHAREADRPGDVATPIWAATYKVEVSNGHYAVSFGDLRDNATGGTPLPTSLFESGAQRWLGISIGAVELEPRLQLSTVPFAFLARRALTAENALSLGGAPAAAYLKAAEAEATYQPKGDYLTTSAAAAAYQPVGEYLTVAAAAQGYQPKGNYQPAGDYQPAGNYQPAGDYVTAQAAAATYQPKGNYLTIAQATQFEAAGAETFVRGSAALAASGAVLTNMAAAADGLAITGPTLPDLEVLSGQTFTVGNEVQQYRNVTVRTGGRITAAAWDGTNGGRVRLRATGTVTIESGASIDVRGLGYRGGVSVWTRYSHGQQGESYSGGGIRTNCTRNYGGGGGGQTDSGNYGQAGAGGGHGSAGGTGLRYGGQPGCDAEGGSTYGDEDLTTLHLGSGGGSAGTDGDKSGRGGDGGRGGGAVSIEAATIVVSGTIDARGAPGTDAYVDTDNGGGGGGAGGSILLWAGSVELRSGSSVTVEGGAGGQPKNANVGGKGGDGRILVKGSTVAANGSITGSARKLATGTQGPSLVTSSATYVSPVITLPAGQLRQVDVFALRQPDTLIAVDACVASSASATSDAACYVPVATSGVVDVAPGAGAHARVRVSVVDRSSGGVFRLKGLRLLTR